MSFSSNSSSISPSEKELSISYSWFLKDSVTGTPYSSKSYFIDGGIFLLVVFLAASHYRKQ